MRNAGVEVQMCVTSPPYYGLRDYGVDGQLGIDQTPDQYIASLVAVFRAVRDVLAEDGTLWVNIGDSYAGAGYSNHKGTGGAQRSDGGKQKHTTQTGCKNKDLIGIPWMLAFALRADGWFLRQDIVWHKPNPMPESVKDRYVKSHEYVFLLSKSARYFMDGAGLRQQANGGGLRTRHSVWDIPVKQYKGAHFAVFPTALVQPCILAGSRLNDIVLDPFLGSGTVAEVAIDCGRRYIGCELNAEYATLQNERIARATARRQEAVEIRAVEKYRVRRSRSDA